MFSEMKLGVQIGLGFTAVLSLLLLIAVSAHFGIKGSAKGFSGYQDLADSTNFVNQLQPALLTTQLGAVNYIEHHSASDIEEYHQRETELLKLLASAPQMLKRPDLVNQTNEIKTSVLEYSHNFQQVIVLIDQVDKIRLESLNPNAAGMETTLAEILDAAFKQHSVDTLYYGAEVGAALSRGQLFIATFLQTSSLDEANKAMDEMGEKFGKHAVYLESSIDDPDQEKRLEQFRGHWQKYQRGIKEIRDIIEERDRLIHGELRKLGPKMIAMAGRVRDAVVADRESIGQLVKAHDEHSAMIVLWLSAGTMLLGNPSCHL